ncbi:MAG: rRNA maturation RNase YbeY [Egibacteraceae bacterium]
MTVYLADEQSRPVDLERLQRLAEYVLADRRVPDAMELSVLCVERDVIASLNAAYMGSEGPTDVLAFPIDYPGETAAGQPSLLGDVVLCPAVAEEHASSDGRGLSDEVELLLVHGILHLLGHDHAEPEEQELMFGLTDQLLTRFRAAARRRDS